MQNSTLNVLITAQDEASDKLKSIGKTAAELGAAFTATGGIILAGLGVAVKAAADAQVQMAKFNTTLDDSKNATPAVRTALLAAAEAAQQLGFDNEDTANSMAKFFQRTGDVTEALKLNQTAMDLSRAKNLDLTTATNLVNLVLSGNGRLLKQYGINLKDSATPLEALGELQGLVGGQSQAFAKTFEGSSEILKRQMEDIQKQIGGALIPILTQLMTALTPIIEAVIKWTQAHPELVRVIVIAVAALGVLLVILGGVALAVAAVSVVMTSTAGIIAVVVIGALALLTAAGIAVVLQWTNIKLFFKSVWDEITYIFQTAINSIVGFFQPLMDIVNSLIDKISTISSGIGKVVSSIGGSIVGAITGHRAQGGNVSGGSPYLVGEYGPEVFVPSGMGNIVPTGNLAGAGSNVNISVAINGGMITEQTAKQIGDIIMRQFNRAFRGF